MNLIIGTLYEQNDFPLSEFKPPKIYISSDEHLIITSEDSLLGYKDERTLSYMVPEATLCFLVLHEIGHHVEGHITELCRNRSFALLKATDRVNSGFEIEADTYAAAKLAEEYDLILLELNKHKEDFDGSSSEALEFLALNTIVTTLTLPFSIPYQPENYEMKGDIKTSIAYREINAIIFLSVKLYKNELCRRAAIFSLFNQTIVEANRFSQEINIEYIKMSNKIDFNDFLVYIRELFIENKRLYYHVNIIPNVN